MMGLFWIALPTVAFGLLAMLLFPEPGPPPRWRARLSCRTRALATRAAAVRRRLHLTRRPSPPPEPDPFAALSLQVRLGFLATQLLALEADQRAWARGKRIQATQAAYDDLLDEACRLAGVELEATAPRTEPERFREEIELASRGWSW
ncbi:hypothetical protein M1R94_08025 [Actinotalea sp. K2]|nr:hypothetical protein [Actinotalea sp. K2]